MVVEFYKYKSPKIQKSLAHLSPGLDTSTPNLRRHQLDTSTPHANSTNSTPLDTPPCRSPLPPPEKKCALTRTGGVPIVVPID